MPAHLLLPSSSAAPAEPAAVAVAAPRLAPLTVTGIGSLPHTTLAAALAGQLAPGPTVVAHVPQLPALGPAHGMLAEAVAGLPGARGSADGTLLLPPLVAGAYRFDGILPAGVTAALHATPVGTRLKGQIAGPLTLALHSRLPDGRRCIDDPVALPALVRHGAAAGAAQAAALASTGAAPLLFIDEPELPRAAALLGRSAVADLLGLVLDALPGTVRGVHCCAEPDLDLMAGLPLDVVSLDAYRYAPAVAAQAPAVARLLARGASIAWGIVPADEALVTNESAEGLATHLCSLWSALATAGVPADGLLRQSLVTPACGPAGLTEAGAAHAMELCTAVAARLRAEAAS